MKSYWVKKFFLVFLILYCASLFNHAMHEFSWLMVAGAALSVWSHARQNTLTPIVLVVHMAIEWIEWIHNPVQVFSWIVRLLHAGMDVTFFYHELTAHTSCKTKSKITQSKYLKPQWWVWGCVLVLIVAVGCVVVPDSFIEAAHPFVLGGVIGCVSSHIWYHIFKE